LQSLIESRLRKEDELVNEGRKPNTVCASEIITEHLGEIRKKIPEIRNGKNSYIFTKVKHEIDRKHIFTR
jgi:hypothetical protein